jgi:hypothetical protein
MKPIGFTMIQALAQMLMVAQAQPKTPEHHLERASRNTSKPERHFGVLKPSFATRVNIQRP